MIYYCSSLATYISLYSYFSFKKENVLSAFEFRVLHNLFYRQIAGDLQPLKRPFGKLRLVEEASVS